MSITAIDTKFFYEMLANGYRNLCRMEAQVNDLNVFPVPDGDTGTNMARTLGGGFGSAPDEGQSVETFMKNFSKAVLLSARGNSGVILSQFIKGLSIACQGKTEIALSDMHSLLTQGTKTAYSAVSNPVEGTMLTVIRSAGEAVENQDFESFEACFDAILRKAQFTLQKTPEMLPVLKEAGVVDSGGMGIIYIFEGMSAYIKGEIIETDSEREDIISSVALGSFGPDSVLEYGYCTEFVLQLMNAKTNIASFSIKPVISYLETIGDSIVAVQDDDIVKVHVHTFTPEKALEFARQYGEFISVKIENMSIQHNEVMEEKAASTPKVKYAVVTVASGEGIKEYLSEIGATRIIDGGQTQNPSAQDFIDAFKSVNAEYIVVLPNNSNILLTAMQAAEMYKDADVRVLPAKTVSQGYAAISMMNTWVEDIDSFIADMLMGIESVSSGSVTKAVHDANIGGIDIKENMYMGISDGNIVCSCEDRISAVLGILQSVEDINSKEVLTVFYGEDVDENDIETLFGEVSRLYPYIECGAINGGQKLYDFYIAVE